MGTSMQSNIPEALAAVNCHQHARLRHEFQAYAGLVKRLSHTQSLKGHSSSVNALDWSSNGGVLLSGSDDCRVKLWSTESSRAIHSFDSVRPLTVCITQAHFPAASGVSASCTHCKVVHCQASKWHSKCAGSHINHICREIHAKHWQ